MARLSKERLATLKNHPHQFSTLILSDSFSPDNFYEQFEDRAEELEQTFPGQGYQLAYDEVLTNAFGGIVAKHIKKDDEAEMLSLEGMLEYFELMLMIPYFSAREDEGLSHEIVRGKDALTPDVLNTFAQILNQANEFTDDKIVAREFESGEVTLDSLAAQVKALKGTIPSREEARKLIAYADYLDNINEGRTTLQTILNFRKHFKELELIDELVKIATYQGKDKEPLNAENLLDEATNGSLSFQNLKYEVAGQMEIGKVYFTDDVAMDIEAGILYGDSEEIDELNAENDLIGLNDDKSFNDSFSLDDDDDKSLADSLDAIFDPANEEKEPIENKAPTDEVPSKHFDQII